MEFLITLAKDALKMMPKGTLKRNSLYYELITYINHTVAFLVYKKYDDAVVFIVRGLTLLNKYELDEKSEFWDKSKYFFERTHNYLKDNQLLSKRSINFLKNF